MKQRDKKKLYKQIDKQLHQLQETNDLLNQFLPALVEARIAKHIGKAIFNDYVRFTRKSRVNLHNSLVIFRDGTLRVQRDWLYKMEVQLQESEFICNDLLASVCSYQPDTVLSGGVMRGPRITIDEVKARRE